MPTSKPTEAQRDELVALDGEFTMEEAARILMAVKPSDLPDVDEVGPDVARVGPAPDDRGADK